MTEAAGDGLLIRCFSHLQTEQENADIFSYMTANTIQLSF